MKSSYLNGVESDELMHVLISVIAIIAAFIITSFINS